MKIFQKNNLKEYDQTFTKEAMSARDLKSVVLSYLASTERKEVEQICVKLFNESNNLTDKTISIVSLLSNNIFYETGKTLLNQSFDSFFSSHLLLVNHWLALHATSPVLNNTVHIVHQLLNHPSFDIKNPNKVRKKKNNNKKTFRKKKNLNLKNFSRCTV